MFCRKLNKYEYTIFTHLELRIAPLWDTRLFGDIGECQICEIPKILTKHSEQCFHQTFS